LIATADGISIPASYTSYLAPITSSKLHAEVTGAGAVNSSHLAEARPAERPYVVMFSAFHVLSAQGGRLNSEKIQECWGFDHPRPDVVVDENGEFPSLFSVESKFTIYHVLFSGLPFTNQHNARSAHLTFHIPQAGVCHGFAGYFEAVLYGDVGLSLHPERSVGDMLSWFPIFFPLQVSNISSHRVLRYPKTDAE
jgi:protein arginine N-methyltransferase 5